MARRRCITDSDGEEEVEAGPSHGGSSRRRRQRSEDHESEDEAILTQYKAESQKAKRRRVGSEEINEAAAPKPLTLNSSEAHLKKLATDYNTSTQHINGAAEYIGDAAEKITEFAKDPPTDGTLVEEVQGLEEHMRDLVDAQTEVDIRKRVLDQIRADLASGTEILDAPQRYARLVEAEMKKYKAKTSRQRYAHNKLYEKFRQKVWEATTDDAMPPMADFIPEEEGDGEGSDDEIAAGAAKIDYKCPLTMRVFDDPVSSTVCRHSFERVAVLDYLVSQRGQGRVPCPASGCSEHISKATLKDNRQLLGEVKNYKRRQQRREEQKKTQQAASTLVD